MAASTAIRSSSRTPSPIPLRMNDRKEAAPPNGGAHYREIASKLRIVARECHFPNARQEQLDIAASFNRRADHFYRPAGANDVRPSHVVPDRSGKMVNAKISTWESAHLTLTLSSARDAFRRRRLRDCLPPEEGRRALPHALAKGVLWCLLRKCEPMQIHASAWRCRSALGIPR
jgi:hypothetical protein